MDNQQGIVASELWRLKLLHKATSANLPHMLSDTFPRLDSQQTICEFIMDKIAAEQNNIVTPFSDKCMNPT